jgi:hypothetical protein
MSIFGKIKDAIFGKAHAAEPTWQAPGQQAGRTAGSAGTATTTATTQRSFTQADVERQLEAKPGADKLNWRTSIVDLMKLIGLEASYDERKELATELGRTDYEGSAEDNIWLHEQVMKKLVQHGGSVPNSLRD